MNKDGKINKTAAEARKDKKPMQRLHVQKARQRAIRVGLPFVRFDFVLLPEIGKELVEQGYNVAITLKKDGTGETFVTWGFSENGRKGSFMTTGNKGRVAEYGAQCKALDINQVEDQKHGDFVECGNVPDSLMDHKN